MQKIIMWSLISIGSGVGAWLPSLWHAGAFSAAGIIGGLLGGVAGWWIAQQIDNYVDV